MSHIPGQVGLSQTMAGDFFWKRQSNRSYNPMRLICDVNQRECVQYRVPARSSTIEIDVDPKLLTLEQRNLIVDNLYEGTRFPRDSELNICPPTYTGLLASVACGIARKHEKG